MVTHCGKWHPKAKRQPLTVYRQPPGPLCLYSCCSKPTSPYPVFNFHFRQLPLGPPHVTVSNTPAQFSVPPHSFSAVASSVSSLPPISLQSSLCLLSLTAIANRPSLPASIESSSPNIPEAPSNTVAAQCVSNSE